jgi:amino acid permease
LKRWFQPLEEGSSRSCSIVLVSTSLGTGFLCIPYAFSLVGLGLGIVTMIFAAVVAALSLQIVMIAARYTGSHSYSSVVELALQRPWTSLVLCFRWGGGAGGFHPNTFI